MQLVGNVNIYRSNAKNVMKENSKFVYQGSRISGKTEGPSTSRTSGNARIGIYSQYLPFATPCFHAIFIHIRIRVQSVVQQLMGNGISYKQTLFERDRTSSLFFIPHSHSHLFPYSPFLGHLNAQTKLEEEKKDTVAHQQIQDTHIQMNE